MNVDDNIGPLTNNRKALHINLDPAIYGTIAEIGAGQEVARFFFRAGGASGTVAKTMSAYDMKFSDEIYGKAPRYVSRERLETMLDREFSLLQQRLDEERGDSTQFFAYANTLTTTGYTQKTEAHGWMGIRFQTSPKAPPNDIILHLRMLDSTADLQQIAVGIVGLNLVYGAFFFHNQPHRLLATLRDNLEEERIEIDRIDCIGPAFAEVNPRVHAIQLVEMGYTKAVLFGPGQTVELPSTVLRKRSILLERGGFRPFTLVNADMIKSGTETFAKAFDYDTSEMVTITEITLRNLRRTQESDHIDYTDLLHRVNILNQAGYTVLVSNYFEYYRLSAYFRRYTSEEIGIVLGINNLIEIFNPEYYDDLDGGILEAFGRLFKNKVHLLIYPMLRESLIAYLRQRYIEDPDTKDDAFYQQLGSTETHLITADNLRVRATLRNLYKYLIETRSIIPVEHFDESHMKFFPRQILEMARANEPGWEQFVTPEVAVYLKSENPFGLE